MRLALAAAGTPSAFGVPFSRSTHGKPTLADAPVSFNLSHTGDRALIALASGGEVGVDIEARRLLRFAPVRRAQILAAARDVCAAHPAELQGEAEIVLAWTALEAQAKAEGCGIGMLLTALGIMGPGSRSRAPQDIADAACHRRRAHGLSVLGLDLGGDLLGAVCAASGLLTPAPVSASSLAIADVAVLAARARHHLPVDRRPSPLPCRTAAPV